MFRYHIELNFYANREELLVAEFMCGVKLKNESPGNGHAARSD